MHNNVLVKHEVVHSESGIETENSGATKATENSVRNAFLTIGALFAVCVGFAAMNINGVALADPGEALWNTIATLISTWVTRLGGVVIFIGGVMFGLGWKNDDAEGKSRGVSTMIAGGIVTAVAALTSQFFA
ncbi:MAG: hypothetical protein FWC20_04405 [Oscillospiraceae bacterium]|nr:hypothetical protein [Oscillospiraceae bacterium]MCL2278634.1 hypothetical protein [Oscillospiraceae bacterium]